MRQATDTLNKIAEDVTADDHAVLKNIARTSMESKIVSVDSGILSALAVQAVLTVAEKTGPLETPNNSQYQIVDLDTVKVQKKPGAQCEIPPSSKALLSIRKLLIQKCRA